MKKLLFILPVLIFIFSSFTPGGGGYPKYFEPVAYYENKAGLYYQGYTDTLSIAGRKGNIEKLEITKEIFIYDIHKNSSRKLFGDQIKDDFIVEFLFEEDLIRDSCILFNKNYSEFNIVENDKLYRTVISDKLIIATFNHSSQLYSVWIAEKSGDNLKKCFSTKSIRMVDIDIYHRIILYPEQKGTEIIFNRVDY